MTSPKDFFEVRFDLGRLRRIVGCLLRLRFQLVNVLFQLRDQRIGIAVALAEFVTGDAALDVEIE